MMALMLAAAILVFSADLRLAVQQFELDQRPPPPPENIAFLVPAHGKNFDKRVQAHRPG